MKKFFALFIVLALAGGAVAADNHVVNIDFTGFAMIALNNADAITLTVDNTAVTAGNAPAGDTDNTKWLNYTALAATGTTYEIVGSLDEAIPDGLKLEVASAAPTGVGSKGTSAGTVELTDSDTPIIGSIGSCWTGVGAFGGRLTYTLSVVTPTVALVADDDTRTVTYTIQAE